MLRRLTAPVLAALTAAALAACGGGGSSSSGGSVTPPGPTPTPAPACNDAVARAPMASVRRLAARAGGATVPDRLYVSYRAGARTAESLARGIQTVRSVELGVDNGIAHSAVTLAPGQDAVRAAQTLRASAGVVDVQPVHARYTTSCTALASDQYFNNDDQWYLFRTSVAAANGNDAWALTHGYGIAVAVIDTGADETNKDLLVKMDVRESVIGGVVKTGAGSVQDTNGHGTNVAGLVAAATNNSYGFASTGWDVHLQIYKVFPDATATSDAQSADTADEARAIRDAIANGASVINLSLGAPQNGGFDQAEHDAVEAAIAAGVTVVAAAGNEYPTSGSNVADYPGAYPGAIAVGASAVQNAQPDVYSSITTENAASYSNSGPTLLAPGGDTQGANDTDALHWIEGYSTTTAAYKPDQCTNNGGVCRALFNGTSQATPQVSGAVALMMAYHGGGRSLSPAQVTTILTQNTDVLSGVPSARQGAGRLNVLRAVAASR